MTIPRYAAELSERLTAMSDKPPTHVDVVELVPPTRDQVRQRVEQTLRTTAEAAGLDLAGMKTAETDARIVTRRLIHKSNLMTVTTPSPSDVSVIL